MKGERKTINEDCKYYLENNEENGVVFIPKFVVERIVNQSGLEGSNNDDD